MSQRLRARAGDERGFSLILTLIVLVVVTALAFTALDAVSGGVGTTRSDLDQKRALLAAYAGLSAYTQELGNNSNYWASCPTATSVTVPGSADDRSIETYSYKELPATFAPSNDDTACDPSDPVSTEIESGTAAPGTFRVEFTGTSQPASGTGSATYKRSIVAQFSPNRFLNYVYFTSYEELDPVAQDPSNPDYTDCDRYLWSTPARDPSLCDAIQFASTDVINGPLHSNDEVTYCGGTTFGAVANHRETRSRRTRSSTPAAARRRSTGRRRRTRWATAGATCRSHRTTRSCSRSPMRGTAPTRTAATRTPAASSPVRRRSRSTADR